MAEAGGALSVVFSRQCAKSVVSKIRFDWVRTSNALLPGANHAERIGPVAALIRPRAEGRTQAVHGCFVGRSKAAQHHEQRTGHRGVVGAVEDARGQVGALRRRLDRGRLEVERRVALARGLDDDVAIHRGAPPGKDDPE